MLTLINYTAAGVALSAMTLWWLGYPGERELVWTVAIAAGVLLVGILLRGA